MTAHHSEVTPEYVKAEHDIFISYSRRDGDFVRKLHQAIAAQWDIWVDWEDIPPTAEWRQAIYAGIEASNNFVFVISNASVESAVCQEEITHAIRCGKRLIPIVREAIAPEQVHAELAKLNWIFFREHDDFEKACQTLTTAIDLDLQHVQMHTRLLIRAREWENRDRDTSLLLRGNYLAEAQDWLAQIGNQLPLPTPLHREYINLSAAAERERQEVELRLRRLSPQQYRNRQALLHKVRNYWVNGVLESSLHERVLIELGLADKADAIANPWNRTLETSGQTEQPIAPGTPTIEIFDQLGTGRSLLILGEPGAGKTTTLLSLARDLIARAEASLDQPIPVVFNLSSWMGGKQTISHWLVEELNNKYQVPKAIAQDWVNRQQLLLLLDGLDEVEFRLRSACVLALNTFHQEYSLEMVVCSRLKDYEALTHRLTVQRAIYLRPLALDQVYHYLDQSGDDLVGLKSLLSQDPTLHELATSPLMLSIMMLAYRGVDITTLPKVEFAGEQRRQLFDAYIQRMFERRGGSSTYARSQTMHWLTWLAQRMALFSETVFLIENMQPEWLRTQRHQVIYRIGVHFLIALYGAVHAGLLAGHQLDLHRFNVLFGLRGFLIGLVGTVLYGIVGGVLAGIKTPPTSPLIGRLYSGFLLGSVFAPVFWLIYGWQGGITYGIIYGIFGVLIYRPFQQLNRIEPVDNLRWSWRKVMTTLPFSLLLGVSLALGTPNGWLPSLIFGLMLSAVFAFERSDEVDQRTLPNQRIWKSAANAGKLFVVLGLATGILLTVIQSIASGVVNGLIFGLGAALIGGQGAGVICFKHLVLRLILWCDGVIPWNYARFLDYACDRIFLQKVGGGYVFIHRSLLEHLAGR